MGTRYLSRTLDFKIRAKHSDKFLTVEDSTPTENSKLVQWEELGGSESHRQIFRFSCTIQEYDDGRSHVEPNNMQQIRVKSNTSLMFYVGAKGNQIGLTTSDGGYIALQKRGDHYLLVNPEPSLTGEGPSGCIDIAWESRDNGAEAISWPTHGASNQLFELVRV